MPKAPSNSPSSSLSCLTQTQPSSLDEEKDAVETEIIQSAPKNLRRKASLLLRKLKQNEHIRWNTNGEFVYRGEVVPHTHIHDLVQDILRKRKNYIPQGWQRFAKALKESNIPHDLVGNQDQWHWMNEEQFKANTGKLIQPLAATASESDVRGQKIKSESSKQLRWTPYK